VWLLRHLKIERFVSSERQGKVNERSSHGGSPQDHNEQTNRCCKNIGFFTNMRISRYFFFEEQKFIM
jgi:hypothetical protein